MPKPRNKAQDEPLKTLRIYCEGEKTEPNYINGYIRNLPSQDRRTVVSVEPTRKNTPKQLVDVAVNAKRSRTSIIGDEFWVVYDREAVGKYSDSLHAAALDKALRNGINVALTNVCFEYWLLLHFVDTTAPYSSFLDLRARSDLNAKVVHLCGCDYEKSSKTLFEAIKNNIPLARKRGQKINQAGVANATVGKSRPFQINPFVGMVELLDAIDAFK